LLSLPIVPLHADPADCDLQAPIKEEGAAADPDSVQRPFERLGELLKRER
jgi:uncharacterized metal-binding protein YceD (DUF177 family)